MRDIKIKRLIYSLIVTDYKAIKRKNAHLHTKPSHHVQSVLLLLYSNQLVCLLRLPFLLR